MRSSVSIDMSFSFDNFAIVAVDDPIARRILTKCLIVYHILPPCGEKSSAYETRHLSATRSQAERVVRPKGVA